MTLSNGNSGVTPFSVTVPRGEDLAIHFSKAGYQSSDLSDYSKVEGGYLAADILFAGLGMLVDGPTGALYAHQESTVTARLDPESRGQSLPPSLPEIELAAKKSAPPSSVPPAPADLGQQESTSNEVQQATVQAKTEVQPKIAERRVALVIGNGNYEYIPRLDNPGNDARLVAKTLESLGFSLVGGDAQVNLGRLAFELAVKQFGDQLHGATIGLFYYAGHGLQVDGENYLVPISANPTRESDVALEMIEAQVVLNEMKDGGARFNVLILDACRNNPFGGRGIRSTSSGLAQMQAPEGTLISYATQPGNVAGDGKGKDSPFTEALAEAIQEPGLDIFKVFNEVGVLVKRKTDGEQQPWISISPIEGDFYFAGGPS